MQINEARLNEVLKLNLRHGTGKSLDEQLCVMQAVDYVTSGGFSDTPECTCPALTRYAIRLNDRFRDDERQKLKPLIPKLIGTRGTRADEIARARYLAYQAVTVSLPILADALELKDVATKLRAFGSTDEEFRKARDYCREQRETFREAARKHAADAAAYAAAAYAADAAAAYAADAAADAAAYAAADADKAKWTQVRAALVDAAVTALANACDVRGERGVA